MRGLFTIICLCFLHGMFGQKSCFEEANRYRFDSWLKDSTKSNLPFDSLTAHIRRSQQMLINCRFPNDTFTTLSGKHSSLGKYAGKILIIDFWSVYCAPCVNAIPSFHALQKKYGKNLTVLGVTLDSKDAILKFLPKHPFNVDIVADARTFFEKYSLGSGYPLTLVVDKKGRIIHFRSGVKIEEESSMEVFNEFTPVIDKALKQK